MPKTVVLTLLLLIVLLSHQPVSSRRGGGSRGGGRSRGGGSKRNSQPNYPRQQPNYPRQQPPVRPPVARPVPRQYPHPPPARKIALATYLAKKMKPKIGFRYPGGRNNRADYCIDCFSINGSDVSCERGDILTPMHSTCYTRSFRRFCATEFGVTSDNEPYVRRSCSGETCSTCSAHLSEYRGNITKSCHVVACQLCNRGGCNYEHIERTFPGERFTVSNEEEETSGFEVEDEEDDDEGDDGGSSSVRCNAVLAATTITFLVAVFG